MIFWLSEHPFVKRCIGILYQLSYFLVVVKLRPDNILLLGHHFGLPEDSSVMKLLISCFWELLSLGRECLLCIHERKSWVDLFNFWQESFPRSLVRVTELLSHQLQVDFLGHLVGFFQALADIVGVFAMDVCHGQLPRF